MESKEDTQSQNAHEEDSSTPSTHHSPITYLSDEGSPASPITYLSDEEGVTHPPNHPPV